MPLFKLRSQYIYGHYGACHKIIFKKDNFMICYLLNYTFKKR